MWMSPLSPSMCLSDTYVCMYLCIFMCVSTFSLDTHINIIIIIIIIINHRTVHVIQYVWRKNSKVRCTMPTYIVHLTLLFFLQTYCITCTVRWFIIIIIIIIIIFMCVSTFSLASTVLS